MYKLLKKGDKFVDNVAYLLDLKENKNIIIICDANGSSADNLCRLSIGHFMGTNEMRQKREWFLLLCRL